jgi:hypothetical protein
MVFDIFDPTIAPHETIFNYAPRPKALKGLKVALVDNSKYNSKALLMRIADRLKAEYGLEAGPVVTKPSPGHSISEADIETLKKTVDIGIAGIGD